MQNENMDPCQSSAKNLRLHYSYNVIWKYIVIRRIISQQWKIKFSIYMLSRLVLSNYLVLREIDIFRVVWNAD